MILKMAGWLENKIDNFADQGKGRFCFKSSAHFGGTVVQNVV